MYSGIIVDFNSRGWQVKQLIDTEPSLFKHAGDQHFVQNMHVSCFNRCLSQMARDPTCATLEKVTIAHTFRAQFASRSRSIRIIYSFRNASCPEAEVRTISTFYRILPLHFWSFNILGTRIL